MEILIYQTTTLFDQDIFCRVCDNDDFNGYSSMVKRFKKSNHSFSWTYQ